MRRKFEGEKERELVGELWYNENALVAENGRAIRCSSRLVYLSINRSSYRAK